ncbi:MAG: AAA family ATPase [Gammaproteobacteria bacterium]|nr:AAA family ATPase [Gammaproteobacteria bacterium]
MSFRHREALAHLLYGIRSDSGFVMLTGEVGTGKTTVCRCLMEQLPEHSNVAFILNPKVTVNELLSSICDELGIAYEHVDRSIKTFVDAISRYLLAQHALGRNTVVIIDEAQNLSADVLEQLRLLTNLETNERKLMRIILLGQPELETMLSRPELKQVEQRITARYNLKPLDRSEINAYVSHRLAVAGCREPVFSARVINKIYAKTRGIPRLINILCDRAMLGAYVKSRRKVSLKILQKATREVQGRPPRQRWFLRGSIVASSLLVVAAAMAALLYTNGQEISLLLARPLNESLPDIVAGSPAAGNPELSQVATLDAKTPEADEGMSALPQWPGAVTAEGNTPAGAHKVLFKQWDIPLTEQIADPCAQANTWGLRCFSGIGNLGLLASIDRPVILALLDSDGRKYDVTLLALKDELATLAFSHGIETVPVQELEARWQGHYQLLWRTSPQGFSLFRPGERGPGVTWLTKNLLAADIRSAQVRDIYDSNVVEAVKAFQRSRGLVADGIAGRQTLIHLNSVNDATVPRLNYQGEG